MQTEQLFGQQSVCWPCFCLTTHAESWRHVSSWSKFQYFALIFLSVFLYLAVERYVIFVILNFDISCQPQTVTLTLGSRKEKTESLKGGLGCCREHVRFIPQARGPIVYCSFHSLQTIARSLLHSLGRRTQLAQKGPFKFPQPLTTAPTISRSRQRVSLSHFSVFLRRVFAVPKWH